MIDEYEDPWGAHQGVPKVQKWERLVPGRAILGPGLTILEHSGPLDKAPRGCHSLLSFSAALPALDQFNENGNLPTKKVG